MFLRREKAPIISFGPFMIIMRVNSNPHSDTKTPNMERSPSLFMMPSEIRVIPIAGMK